MAISRGQIPKTTTGKGANYRKTKSGAGMKRLNVDENTAISMPARNLISIISACLVGAWFGFGVIERLNSIETQLQLIEKDLEAANDFY